MSTPFTTAKCTALLMLLSLWFPQAQAKRAARLIELKPMLDTSVLPKRTHFELKVKHTEIVYPENPGIMLHGGTKAKVFRLTAKEDSTVLRGNVVADQPASPISTSEHGVKPLFALDLKKLTAKIAPDIAREMEAQIAAARRKMALDVERQEKLMQRELQAQKPRPDMPAQPGKIEATLAQTNDLENDRQRAQERARAAAAGGAQQMQGSLGNAKGAAVPGMPVFGAPLISFLPGRPKGTAAIPQAPKVNVDETAKQMAAESAGAKYQAPSTAELAAQMQGAKNKGQTTVSYAQPQMDAILTHLRQIPPAATTSGGSETGVQADPTSVIEWDAWHAKFAQLARNPILAAVGKRQNPAGANTIEITVSASHQLTLKLTKSSNDAFDRAIIEAYQTLNSNPGLQFPSGSRRNSLTFSVDNEHRGTGIPSGVQSQTSVGDKEIVPFTRKR